MEVSHAEKMIIEEKYFVLQITRLFVDVTIRPIQISVRLMHGVSKHTWMANVNKISIFYLFYFLVFIKPGYCMCNFCHQVARSISNAVSSIWNFY